VESPLSFSHTPVRVTFGNRVKTRQLNLIVSNIEEVLPSNKLSFLDEEDVNKVSDHGVIH
jgi:hypothetical protein